METLTNRDRSMLYGFLEELREDKESYIRMLSHEEIDIPLSRLLPEEDAAAARLRIRTEQLEKLEEIIRLQGLLKAE